MSTETVRNFDKVMDYINENQIWDDICMNIADDHEGNTYIICESWDNVNKLADVVRDVLGIEEEKVLVNELLGVEVVFSDEYTTCSDCHHVIRTSPDSYHWQPNFYVGDGFIVCSECFNDDEYYQEEYLEDKINNPKQAVNGLMTEEQIEELGFKKLDNEYERGLYNINDNPETIYKALSKDFEEVLFYINNVEQFRINFIAFVRGEIKQ